MPRHTASRWRPRRAVHRYAVTQRPRQPPATKTAISRGASSIGHRFALLRTAGTRGFGILSSFSRAASLTSFGVISTHFMFVYCADEQRCHRQPSSALSWLAIINFGRRKRGHTRGVMAAVQDEIARRSFRRSMDGNFIYYNDFKCGGSIHHSHRLPHSRCQYRQEIIVYVFKTGSMSDG